jgi:vacuolar iron transporter family protein
VTAGPIQAIVAGTTLIGVMAPGGLGASVGGAGVIKGAIRVTFWGAATAAVGWVFDVAA